MYINETEIGKIRSENNLGLRNWQTPDDLSMPDFNQNTPSNSHMKYTEPENQSFKPIEPEPEFYKQRQSEPEYKSPPPKQPTESRLNNVLSSLLGGSGGFDIGSIMGLFSKDNKDSLGSLSTLLPLLQPLLQNGGLGNLFGTNKKPAQDAGSKTIDLNNYTRVK